MGNKIDFDLLKKRHIVAQIENNVFRRLSGLPEVKIDYSSFKEEDYEELQIENWKMEGENIYYKEYLESSGRFQSGTFKCIDIKTRKILY